MAVVARSIEPGDSAVMGAPNTRRVTRPAWSLRELKRPMTLLVAAATTVIAGYVISVASCAVHEISHALVGTALGWEVDQVILCPGDAQVVYVRTTDAWYANPLESFAGGIGAALFILAAYWLVFVRRDRPLRGPLWWSAGLGVLAGTGAQIVVGVAEGVAGIVGSDYTQTLDDHLIISLAVLAAAMLAFGALHVWLWRALWHLPNARDARGRSE